VGRGSIGVVEAPRMVAEPGADDHRLVAAVRRGDDRAFEALYSRYHRRIHAYVLGMVKDHGRAEDVTQEVFVSALRRMRETERPIAFKPWIYEIAKNACIDQFRRSKRTEEVSLQADDGLAPSDYGKLVGSEPSPDAAVAAKQDLDNLCGAFGGLSDTHHEILVLRELEGMSYREIGERMGMSRPAVESTLFRARRRLGEEYDDLVSGARCQRIQGLIQAAASSRLGARETRRLSRHVAHCQPCRREALAAGLDSAILTHVPLRKRAASKIGALLPFPIFGRGRAGDGGGWSAQMPLFSEQASSGWGKLATAAAVLVAGAGATGVGTQVADSKDDPARGGAAVERSGAAPASAATDKSTRPAGGSATGERAERAATGPRRPDRAGDRAGRRGASDRSSDGGGRGVATSTTGTGGGASGKAGGGGGGLPAANVPAAGKDPVTPVRDTVENVGETAQPVVEGVQETAGGATETVGGATETAGGAVEGATAPVQEAVDDVGGKVEGATGADVPLVP
jgi:RNA polymerase sigma factor (sigma-70 family)